MSFRHDGLLTVMDWFCGAGGSSQGMHAVPGVRMSRAANHWQRAVETHAMNFPDVDHYRGDIREAPVEKWPVTDLFWASPECPQWSNARGKRRDFDTSLQPELFGEATTDEEAERSRALMEEVPQYLRGVIERGGLVKAGVVENVIDVRAWDQWHRWLGEIRKLGYITRTIAINSMHAEPRSVQRAPQSRDRLYVAYWHASLGRSPDWNKWLRPTAWCGTCGESVQAVQVFKDTKRDMGRYRQQYVYRCPRVACRNQVLEPSVLPAAAAIDWSLPGQRIGDRVRPLAAKTLARIRAGLEKFAQPTSEAAFRAIPPILVPVEGRVGKGSVPATVPLRTQTARNETGLAWLPFITELRGGGSDARSVSDALATVTASGNHHGLVTHDRHTLVRGDVDLDDVRFRMLEPQEIGRAMSFADSYTVLGSKRERVRQYGNAVTPNVAEVLTCALVEAITGTELDRYAETASPFEVAA